MSRLLKIIGLFSKEPYILPKRPIILRSLLIVATPCLILLANEPLIPSKQPYIKTHNKKQTNGDTFYQKSFKFYNKHNIYMNLL